MNAGSEKCTITTTCADANVCQDLVCNESNGACVYTDNGLCDDNNQCTNDMCNAANPMDPCTNTPIVCGEYSCSCSCCCC